MKASFQNKAKILTFVLIISFEMVVAVGLSASGPAQEANKKPSVSPRQVAQIPDLVMKIYLLRPYVLLLDSFFKKMDKLLYIPISQFQGLYLAYFRLLRDQKIIDQAALDNLSNLLMNFVNRNWFLYDFSLLPKDFVEVNLKKSLTKPESQGFFVGEQPSIQFNKKVDLDNWLAQPNEPIDELINVHQSLFLTKEADLVAFILRGFNANIQKKQANDEEFNFEKRLNSFLARSLFLKTTTLRFNHFLKDLLIREVKDQTSQNSVVTIVENLSNLLVDSLKRNQWLGLRNQIEHEYWNVAKSDITKLVDFVDIVFLSNSEIVDPQFRTYYLLKFKDMIDRLSAEQRSAFLSNPEALLDVLRHDFFFSFNQDRFVMNAFRFFSQLLGILPSSILLKTFEAYSFELKNINLIEPTTERRLEKVVKNVVDLKNSQNSKNKMSKNNNDLESFRSEIDGMRLGKSLNAPTKSDHHYDMNLSRYFDDKEKFSSNYQSGLPNLNRVLKNDNIRCELFLNSMIGVSHNAIKQIRNRGKIYWKTYREFYNLKKPAAIAFHLKTLMRMTRPYTKFRGFYLLRTVLSHYADRLEDIKIVSPGEKKFFIRTVLGILMRGYMRMDTFNLKMAFKKYKDHALAPPKIANKPLISKTQIFINSKTGSFVKHTAGNQYYERIMDHKKAQKRAIEKLNSQTFLKTNYKFRTGLNKAIDRIVERIRDKNIKQLPKIVASFNSRLWNNFSLDLKTHSQNSSQANPAIERVMDYKRLIQPSFGLTFIECFRQHFQDLKFHSWSSLQSALRKYISNVEGLSLQPEEISMLNKAIGGLKPFYSYGNIDFGKFMANYPEDVEIVTQVSNPRASVLEIFQSLKKLKWNDMFEYWSHFIDITASFYPKDDVKKLKDFLPQFLDCLLQDKKIDPTNINQVFKSMQEDILSAKESVCNSSMKDKKEILRQFLVFTPFESIVRAKNIVASAKHIFLYQTQELNAFFRENQRTFSELLGYPIYHKIEQLLASYSTMLSTNPNISIYRKSDHIAIKNSLSKEISFDNEAVDIMFNLFNQFSKVLLVVEPLTTVHLKSFLETNMQFCSHSSQHLNILFERLKVNERLGEKKAVLNFIRNNLFFGDKIPFNSKRAFNLYKVIYHMKLTNAKTFTTYSNQLKSLFAILKEKQDPLTLSKTVLKLIEKIDINSQIMNKQQLSKLAQSGDAQGKGMSSIRKKIFKLLEQNVVKLAYSNFYRPSSSNTSEATPGQVLRARYYKNLSNQIRSKLILANIPKPKHSNEKLISNVLTLMKSGLKVKISSDDEKALMIKKAQSLNALLTEKSNSVLKKKLFKYVETLKRSHTSLKSPKNITFNKLEEKAIVNIIRKSLFKTISETEAKVTRFVNNAQALYALVKNTINPTIKKKLFKSVLLIQTLQKRFKKNAAILSNQENAKEAISTLKRYALKTLPNIDDSISKFIDKFQGVQASVTESSNSTSKVRMFKYVNTLNDLKIQIKNNSQLVSNEISEYSKVGIIKKSYFKPISGLIDQMSSFVAKAQAIHHFLSEKLTPTLKKKLMKYVDIVDKIKSDFIATTKPMAGTLDEASKADVIKRLFLKYVSPLNEVNLSLVNQIQESLASTIDSNDNMAAFSKKLLKPLNLVEEIKLVGIQLLNGLTSDANEASSVPTIQKNALKTFNKLENGDLTFLKYLDPSVSDIVANPEESTATIVKNLYKYLKETSIASLSIRDKQEYLNLTNNLVANSDPIIGKNVLKYLFKQDGKLLKALKKMNAIIATTQEEKNTGVLKSKLIKYVSNNININLNFRKKIVELISKLSTDKSADNPQVLRSKLVKFISTVKQILMVYKKTPTLMFVKLDFSKAGKASFSSFKSKLIKYQSGKNSKSLLYRNKFLPNGFTKLNKPKTSVFKSHLSKYLSAKKNIIATFNKRNFMELVKQKSSANKVAVLKSKVYKILSNHQASSLSKSNKKLNGKWSSGSQGKLGTMRSSFIKAMFKEEIKGLAKKTIPGSRHAKRFSKGPSNAFGSKILKYILSESGMSATKRTDKSFQGILNKSFGQSKNYGSTLLKQSSTTQKVMLKYLKSRLNSTVIKRMKQDSTLKSIIFNMVMKDTSQKLAFLRFASKYVKEHAILASNVNMISQKVIFKQLESLNTEKKFLRFIRETQDPRIANKLVKLRAKPNNRQKFQKLMKIFGGADLVFRRKSKPLTALGKLKKLFHDFRKVQKITGENANREQRGDLSLIYTRFINRMSKLIQDPNDFGKMAVNHKSKDEEPVYVCCSCCCNEESGDCANKDCGPKQSQDEINKDDAFIEKATSMINIDPIVNIHIRIRNEKGQYLDKETFTLNSARDLSDETHSHQSSEVLQASSSRLI